MENNQKELLDGTVDSVPVYKGETSLEEKKQSYIPAQSHGTGIQIDSLIQLAIEKDFDIERLDKLLQLKERLDENEAKKAYYEAMAEFKKNPPVIYRDSVAKVTGKTGVFSYDYSSIGHVVEQITKGLSEFGISAKWTTQQTEKSNDIYVTCVLTHFKGYSEKTTLKAAPDVTGSKNSIQAVASTITYLERYTLLAITGLASNEFDNDANMMDDEQRKVFEKLQNKKKQIGLSGMAKTTQKQTFPKGNNSNQQSNAPANSNYLNKFNADWTAAEPETRYKQYKVLKEKNKDFNLEEFSGNADFEALPVNIQVKVLWKLSHK